MKLYRNAQTGEITESHREAVEWYRSGATVEILVNDEVKASWVH